MRQSALWSLVLCLLLVTHCRPQQAASAAHEVERKLLDFLREHGEHAAKLSAVEIIQNFERRQAALPSQLSSARALFFSTQSMAGLGNRMVALVSAFLMSVCTDRVLVVDWPDYDKPEIHRSSEVSTMLPMDRFFHLCSLYDARIILASQQNQKEFGWDYAQWASLNDNNVSAFKQLQTQHLNTLFPQRVLAVSAISFFGSILEQNPFHGPWLRQHFGDNPFPEAARYILKPSAEISALVNGYYLQHFAGRRIVAIHLRTIEYMSLEQQGAALRCALFLSGSHASSIFVAADTAAGMSTAQRELGAGFLSHSSVPPGRAGAAALIDGIVNLFLMSKADALVGTSRSSFTLLAAGLHGGAQTSARPLYDVIGSRCFRVTCPLPRLQRDHPLATLVQGYNSSCLAGATSMDAGPLAE
mmetsp:Transcript_37296/g.88092  ORF Transcript_37296/g.88092 Transcript_37296/m.88092 type:complete len:415 (-) Transcript_37296:210-1454(-)